jgi:hypothetical protein
MRRRARVSSCASARVPCSCTCTRTTSCTAPVHALLHAVSTVRSACCGSGQRAAGQVSVLRVQEYMHSCTPYPLTLAISLSHYFTLSSASRECAAPARLPSCRRGPLKGRPPRFPLPPSPARPLHLPLSLSPARPRSCRAGRRRACSAAAACPSVVRTGERTANEVSVLRVRSACCG